MKKIISIVTTLIMASTLAFVPVQFAMADTDEENAVANEQVIQTNGNDTSLKAAGEGEILKEEPPVVPEPVPVTGMTLNKTTAKIAIDGIVNLKVKVEPSDATNQTPTWKSSNKLAAKVDSKGKVTGVRAGTATITATIKDSVSGQSFKATCKVTVKPPTVSKVSGLKYVSCTTKTIKIKWSRVKNATKYEIWRARGSSKTYKKVATTSKLEYTDNNLSTPSGYKYKVRAKLTYTDALDSKKTAYGKYSSIVYAATKPGKVYWKVSKKLVSNFPYVTANWNKKSCSGYVIWASKYPDFKVFKRYVVSKKDITSKDLDGLKDGKKYYFKIKAYYKYNGRTTYGEWSAVKTKTVNTTGWEKSGIKQYYYQDGNPYSGEITLNGNPYYFNEEGVLSGVNEKMAKKVKKVDGSTKYTISVSRQDCRICILQKEDDDWVVVRYAKCTCGASSTPSPYGTFSILSKKPTFGKPDQYSVWNASRFVNKVYFHSVLYAWHSKTAVIDGRLGYHLSHGCIRLSMSESAWVYNNVAIGTKVVILY